MVVFHEFVDWDHAVFISFDFLINVECLQFCQDLDNCLLHASLHHERTVVWGSETLFSNLYAVDWSHSITDLVILLCHELTSLGVLVVVILKDENFTLLSEIYFVQGFNTWISCVQIVVEMTHILVGQSVQFPDFKETGNSLLESYLIRVVHFHQNNMHDIDDQKDIDCIVINLIALHEVRHDCKVTSEHKGISS